MKLVECPYCSKNASEPLYFGWFLLDSEEPGRCNHCHKELKINFVSMALFNFISIVSFIVLFALIIMTAGLLHNMFLELPTEYLIIAGLILAVPIGMPILLLWSHKVLPILIGDIFRVKLFKKDIKV